MKFFKLFKFLTFLAIVFVLLALRPVQAAPLDNIFSSPDSIVVKVQEGVEYFFAFKVEKKVTILEKHADKRLVLAQDYAEEGNNKKVKNLLQSYQQIKEKQNNLLEKINDGKVLGMVEERTVEQQKTMEKIKNRVDVGTKDVVIQVQEQVVNQVAQRVVVVNGTEGQTEFFQKVEHVWAPGTGPGGEAGVVVVGGTMQFAPGTSGGGSAGADIKNVEVKTGGGSDGGGTTVEGGNPGTTSGGNTVESGSQDMAPGTTSGGETGIAP